MQEYEKLDKTSLILELILDEENCNRFYEIFSWKFQL